MHYYHAILSTGSESKEEAEQKIDEFLESYNREVYDYYQITETIKVTPENIDKIWKVLEDKMNSTDNSFDYNIKQLEKSFVENKVITLSDIKNITSYGGMFMVDIGKYISEYYYTECFFYNIEEWSRTITKEQLAQNIITDEVWITYVDLHN